MKALFRRLMRPLLELQVRRLIAAKKLRIVGVTGAVGKTSTKLAIADVLRQKYRVLVHPGNFNADISLPLAIFEQSVPSPIINPIAWLTALWRMEQKIHGNYPYEVLVLELGTDHPGEIPHFMTYLQPEVGVTTAIAPEHMEFFGDLGAVAKEELAIVEGSRKIVVGRDDVADEYWQRYVATHPAHYGYGLGTNADYGVVIHRTDPVAGTVATFYKSGQPRHDNLKFGRCGAHSAKAAAAALAVGDLMGLSPRQLEAGLAALKPVSGRMQPLLGRGGSTLIDDTYNSSPEAAYAALETLAAIHTKGRRIAIMGSMNELGDNSPSYHAEVGAACTNVDLLITIGSQANEHLGPAAVKAGLSQAHWKAFKSPYDAGRWLVQQLGPGDIVLAKGSQNGVFAEETVKLILADPTDATKLVRQSPVWLRRKAEQFPDAKPATK